MNQFHLNFLLSDHFIELLIKAVLCLVCFCLLTSVQTSMVVECLVVKASNLVHVVCVCVCVFVCVCVCVCTIVHTFIYVCVFLLMFVNVGCLSLHLWPL